MVEIDHIRDLEPLLERGELAGAVFHAVDLRPYTNALLKADLAGAAFLGCEMEHPLRDHVMELGCLVFPQIDGLPYLPFRAQLYTPEELYDGFDPAEPASYQRSLDYRVYEHWKKIGHASTHSVMETLAQRVHDHSISNALYERIADERVVAIMGGHSMSRAAESYRAVARVSRELTRAGYLLCSGGGPGAMEATHLGAWFAQHDEDDLDDAIAVLATEPKYTGAQWLSRAFEVRRRWPCAGDSLGIPTWHYGHEPPNPFASHIAKYFANSVREDGLLAIATAGVVYTPGSAGTIQEIFQDACQNHYVTMGIASPMVFLGRTYWTEEKPVYPLVERLAEGREYAKWLSLVDTEHEVVRAISDFNGT